MHSNIFYLLFIINSLVPFTIDFSFQFYRNQRLSDSAQYLIIIFAINGFLWLDFNMQMLFKAPSQTSVVPRLQEIAELMAESTDCSACLLAAPLVYLATRCATSSQQVAPQPDRGSEEQIGEVSDRGHRGLH